MIALTTDKPKHIYSIKGAVKEIIKKYIFL